MAIGVVVVKAAVAEGMWRENTFVRLPSSAHKLANSAKLTYASRVSEKEDEVEEATCVEAAEEEACRRLVELVDVHVTILRVVAADVQAGEENEEVQDSLEEAESDKEDRRFRLRSLRHTLLDLRQRCILFVMKGNQQNGEEEAREESDRHTSTPSPYRLSKARGNAGKAGKTQVLAHLVRARLEVLDTLLDATLSNIEFQETYLA